MIYHFFDPLPQDNFTRLQTYMAEYFNHDDREYTIMYKFIVSMRWVVSLNDIIKWKSYK